MLCICELEAYSVVNLKISILQRFITFCERSCKRIHRHRSSHFEVIFYVYILINFYLCFQTYMLLGEALMKVDEPEEAMRAFEVARKKSPLNATVSKKVGQALVASYEYRKAVEHYEDTLASNKESPDKLELLYDFGGSVSTTLLLSC